MYDAEKPARARPAPTAFQPIRMLEIELSQSLPPISAVDPTTGRRYGRALALVRLHSRPLGRVMLQLGEHGLAAEAYAAQIWDQLGTAINEHLRDDGLPTVTALPAQGFLAAIDGPRCGQERELIRANAPFVSVVVTTHNRRAGLDRCLRSVLALGYPNLEIIVVDNAPATDEAELLIREEFSRVEQVRYVREDRTGGGWARNRGLLEAKAEIVAFLDDDIVVDHQWLTELVSAFNVSPKVACVTGLILAAEIETAPQEWIEQYGGYGKGFARRIFDLRDNRPDNPLYPYTAGMFGSGANMAFRTAVLRSIGGFDPALGAGTLAHGGEDLAVFYNCIRHGYQLVYEPAAIVHHPHHSEYAKLRAQIRGYGIGLTAFLTKCVVDDPRLLIELAGKVIPGVSFVFSPRSAKNERKHADYPGELTTIERKGMLYGPLAYVRSRRRVLVERGER